MAEREQRGIEQAGTGTPDALAPTAGDPGALAMEALHDSVRRARGGSASLAAGAEVTHALEQVARAGPGRASADVLLALLSSGALEGLSGPGGRSCRAAAVGVLVEFGYPFALEVSPEDLAHWRERHADSVRYSGAGAALLLTTLTGAVALFGLSTRALPGTWALALGDVAAAAAALAVGPGAPLHRIARRVLVAMGLLGIVLTVRMGLGALLPGAAALGAAWLLREA